MDLRSRLRRWGDVQRRASPPGAGAAQALATSDEGLRLAMENGYRHPGIGCQTVTAVRDRLRAWS